MYPTKALKPNSTRLPALDLARIIAMLMMISGHTITALINPVHLDLNSDVYWIWDFIRGLTAPTFLLISGAVAVFANKREQDGSLSPALIKRRLKMALTLIAIGYLLAFPADKLIDLQYLDQYHWDVFFRVNILQLIGATQLLLVSLFILVKDEKKFAKASLIVGLSISALTPAVHLVNWFQFMPSFLAEYFSLSKGSIFCIFPFSAFMFFGAFIGCKIKEAPVESRNDFLMKKLPKYGLVSLIFGLPLFIWQHNSGLFAFYDLYKANFGLIFVRIGLSLLSISAISYLYSKTERYKKYFMALGNRALLVYVLHIFAIYGAAFIPGLARFYELKLDWGSTFLCLAGVYAFVIMGAISYDFKSKEKPWTKKAFRFAAYAYVFYVLFV